MVVLKADRDSTSNCVARARLLSVCAPGQRLGVTV
jgi:hypothetical protein